MEAAALCASGGRTVEDIIHLDPSRYHAVQNPGSDRHGCTEKNAHHCPARLGLGLHETAATGDPRNAESKFFVALRLDPIEGRGCRAGDVECALHQHGYRTAHRNHRKGQQSKRHVRVRPCICLLCIDCLCQGVDSIYFGPRPPVGHVTRIGRFIGACRANQFWQKVRHRVVRSKTQIFDQLFDVANACPFQAASGVRRGIQHFSLGIGNADFGILAKFRFSLEVEQAAKRVLQCPT